MTNGTPIQCTIPEFCVVLLIGPSGCGKTTFAQKHFKPTEILSSDTFRGMVTDDERDQTATKDAFDLLYGVAHQRLRRGKTTVFDATNVQPFAVEHIARLARDHYTRVVAFAFNLPLAECLAQNATRNRQVPEHVIRKHMGQYRHLMHNIRRYKDIRNVWTFNSAAEAMAAQITRTRSRHYKHFDDSGPFDVIGDVHGCAAELQALLEKLGYSCTNPLAGNPEEWFDYRHPQGRKAVFVGDYIDRGPDAAVTLMIVRTMEKVGSAICLPGNHDVRLARKLFKATPEELLKNPTKLTHGLQITLESLRGHFGIFHGTDKEGMAHEETEQRRSLVNWIGNLPSHVILDHGNLVVSHAGLREEMIGRSHGMVREFCLYGNRIGTGEDEDGFPIREDWAKDYRGKALIAYGHIHAGMAEFRNNTICLDTNVYMGGALTALRYPEREIVSVPAEKIYFKQERAAVTPAPGDNPPEAPSVTQPGAGGQPIRAPVGTVLVEHAASQAETRIVAALKSPQAMAGDLGALLPVIALTPEATAAVEQAVAEAPSPTPAMRFFMHGEGLVDIADLLDKRRVDTRLIGPVSFNRDMAAAALEQISRFSVDPRWLIYLPPTMSPCETAPEGGFLERPEEAFAYYRERNVSWIVCEEKHMGSRLIAIACRDEKAAFERFGVRSSVGACYSRLGRAFFTDRALEQEVLNGIRSAMDRAGLWDTLKTNWICLDCELMPWSAKASGLLHRMYAGSGRAGSMALHAEANELAMAGSRTNPLQAEDQAKIVAMASRWLDREKVLHQYIEAYRRYCWPTEGVKGLKLAPFHVLATEGQVHVDKSHLWHMAMATALAEGSSLLVPTPYKVVQLSGDDAHPLVEGTHVEITSLAEAAAWWHKMTARQAEIGAVADVEGMVVKPLNFTPPVDEKFGRVQPALKCRGREYLRIIYGPEYTTQLEKLRKRGLGSKRRLAVQEFALGIEGLERFVRKAPLARVHECAFAVLALECEPLDPRL